MSDVVESLRAIRKRRPWADSVLATCPDCGHASHAGRCHANNEPTPGRLVGCLCKHKREAPDGDPILGAAEPGRGVAVADPEGRVGGMMRAFLAGHAEHMQQYVRRGEGN